MPFLFERLYGRLGTKYFGLYVVFEVVSAFVVCLATVGLFTLYVETTADELWRVVAVAELAVAVAVAYSMTTAWRLSRPIRAWIREGRPEQSALEAWRCAAAIPRQFVVANGWPPFAIVCVPVSIYATIEFDLPAHSALIVFAGAMVAVAYAAILHFFASELFMRPLLEDIARHLPRDFAGTRLGVPLRWKLLGALPLINVITGVVASGLSTDGSAQLSDLGLDVVVAVLVAFTVSFELTLLLTQSILRPVDDLLEATEAVKRGDLDARVPVASGDELGALAGSFNEMMQGVSERDRLRTAFGSYVDPEVAQRVLDQGELLEGEEREVTVMSVDLRDFTERAERSSARETVAFLNEFFDVVVPRVLEHGATPTSSSATACWRSSGLRSGSRTTPIAPCGTGDRGLGRRAVRRRGQDRHRNQLRPGGGRIGRRRWPARLLGDRRRGQRGVTRGEGHARGRLHGSPHRSHAGPPTGRSCWRGATR